MFNEISVGHIYSQSARQFIREPGLFYLPTDYITLCEYNTVPSRYHNLNISVFNAYFSDTTYFRG